MYIFKKSQVSKLSQLVAWGVSHKLDFMRGEFLFAVLEAYAELGQPSALMQIYHKHTVTAGIMTGALFSHFPQPNERKPF